MSVMPRILFRCDQMQQQQHPSHVSTCVRDLLLTWKGEVGQEGMKPAYDEQQNIYSQTAPPWHWVVGSHDAGCPGVDGRIATSIKSNCRADYRERNLSFLLLCADSFVCSCRTASLSA